ncbi:VCBS domain-containing protein [Bradyrhizobium ontarionense]|uniref:VCBS domain-containing protein n=1 Tax=Bradyrhizobium ontarionense TaxID=2898149 RepID=A0ABY3R495_9BRAD|nr:VCBS domain-containing protein [Bradyrhizobium sp. A19]UFZ01661.1 VCBS domain-containing protein [Bradyrhizobium sp. A19]
MNYAGKFEAALFSDGLNAHAHAHVRLDAPPAHAPADAIVVADAHFLFNADFKRSGVDLILSADGREVLLPDYFKGEKRAALASPDGAHLTGELVNALSGSVQLSQAGAAAAAGKVIGHVTKLQGTATAVRNGVSILLHQGDNVEKGDVVQSGSDSTLGITFIDGTVFGLSSNARMVLNEMVYDPNGSNNSSLISLVAGTISFVAGETAKHGDMKVDTPVATMGIRGTAVLVEIDFTVPGQGGLPDAKFQVLVEPDGRTGSYVLFDKTTLQPIAVVNQAGQQIQISNGVVNQSAVPLSPDIQKLINDVFTLKFTDNTNPKSTTHFTDIGVLQTLTPLTLANGTSAVPTFLVTDTSSTPTTSTTSEPPSHIPGPPEVRILDATGRLTSAFGLTERAGQTGNSTDLDAVLSRVNFTDVNGGDRPTVSVSFKAYTYKTAQQGDVTGALSQLQLQDVLATAVKISVAADPGNVNHGSATLTYSVPDNTFDFLAAGETLTLTYVVRVDTNFPVANEFKEVPITITVTGTNDVPVITTSARTITFTGGTSVPGGPLTSDDPTSGSLNFTDVDLTDSHTVSAKLASAVLQGGGSIPPTPLALFEQALTAQLASDSTGSGTGKVNWSFGNLPVYVADFIPAGQTLTLTYTVTVTDSQGAASTQMITVTITGTDDPAVVWIATTQGQSGESHAASVLLWSDGANWETGLAPTAADDVIIITDQLHGLTPAFPVTIDAAAFARSVSLNDFGGGAVPELDNHGTLAISGALTAKADARIYNFGSATISVGGLAQILDQSVLNNAGKVVLAGGGEFGAAASITNSGRIELSGGTLTVRGDVENTADESSGLIQVDTGATLALAGGSIDGGTILIQGTPVIHTFGTLESGFQVAQRADGVLALQGGATISNGGLDNFGRIEVSGSGNAVSNESVTNSGLIDIKANGGLTLDLDTGIDNAEGLITVEQSAKLTLSEAHLTGGTLTNEVGGTVALTGHAALIGGTLGNFGVVAISGSGNVLEDESVTNANAAAITIALSGVLALTGTNIAGGAITNDGLIEVTGDSTIDGSAVAGGAIVIGAWGDGNGGGNIHAVVTTEDGPPETPWTPVTLTIQGGAMFTDAVIAVSDGSVLEVASSKGATLAGVSVDNLGTVQIGQDALLLLEDSTITGGDLVNRGTVHIETAAATTFESVHIDNAGGEIIIDDDGDAPVPSTLVLDGGTSLTGGTLSVGVVGTLEITGYDVTLSDMHVDNSGVFTVDLGAMLALAGTDVSGGGTLYIYGTITASGFTSIGGSVINDGTIEIVGGTFEITGSISGSGTIAIDPGAILHLASGSTQTIDFSGDGSSELVVDDTSFAARITGLGVSDKIDLSTVHWSSATTASYDSETGVLTVSDGAGHSVNLTLSGADYSGAHFVGSSDGQGGTLITLAAADAAPVIADPEQAGAITETIGQTASSVADSVGGTIHFGDVDLTDRPTAAILANAQSVTWTAADHHTNLSDQLTSGQIAALEQALQLAQSGTTNNGSVGWTYAIPDGSLDFLGEGQSVTVTSTVTLDDHRGGTATSSIVVTITGTNDQPVVTSDVQTAEIAERVGKSGSDLRDTASGTITFADADVTDTHVIKVTDVVVSGADDGLPSDTSILMSWLSLGRLTDSGHGGAGAQPWTFSAKDKVFDYLGADQQVTLTYTVEIDDGHGGVVDVPITITVKGAEDAPVIVGETNPTVQTVILSERAAVLATGTTVNAEGMATETFDQLSDGSDTNEGRAHGSFYSQALHATFTADGNAGVVHGSSSASAAPYMPGGQDQTNYLSIGGHAQETITFDSAKNSFGLYWGSVDSYNSISFYNGNKLVASYTGSDVAPLIANGGQGSFASNGYVEFLGLSPFNKVVLASSQNAFELDNVSAGSIADQPVKLASDMSGTLTILDKDFGDTLTASVLGNGVVKYNGSSSLPADAHVQALADAGAISFDSATSDGDTETLHWSYHPADVNLDFLKPGDTLTVTYQAEVSDGHGSSGTKALTVTLVGNGASTVNGTSQDDTFVNVGDGVTIFGKGGNDSFVFNPHFGSATIGDFDVNKDTIEIDHSLFASIEAILGAARTVNGDTIITDAAHDTITLKGVTVTQLQHHQNDFHIV